MNIAKLFSTQRILNARIEKEHPRKEGEDRLAKMVLALIAELGECANEWRGFKFWSHDQEPRIKVPITLWGGPFKNPLLEEFADGLHLVLDIGLEIQAENYFSDEVNFTLGCRTKRIDAIKAFKDVNKLLVRFDDETTVGNYGDLFSTFMTLGDSLGFTEEQIEQAYYDKNEINHERQNSGY